MGWCSATSIFDEAIQAAHKLQCSTLDNKAIVDFPNPALIEFAKTIRDILEDGDWDCQQESDFYEALKYDLWPKYAEEDDYWESVYMEQEREINESKNDS